MIAEIRRKLMKVAEEQAELLKQREDILGITLYGSLAAGDVTPFSDIDMIAVIQGEEPEYLTEHRVVNDLKVDIKPLSMDRVRSLPEKVQESLRDFQSGTFIEAMMRGADDVILYDPSGEIASIRATMCSGTPYRKLALPYAREHIDRMTKEYWPQVVAAYDEGGYDVCARRAKSIVWWASYVLDLLTGHKDISVAAERLGISEICQDYTKLESLCAPSGDSMERFHYALKDAWEFSLEKIYEPLKNGLSDSGVPEPEKLELICDHRAFLPYYGCRCMELGRAIAETNLSLRWMKFHIDEGMYDKALSRIGFAHLPDALEQQWEHISNAVKHSGYDMSALINGALRSDEYKQKVELARQAADIERKQGDRQDAETAMQCVQNIRAAAENVIRKVV